MATHEDTAEDKQTLLQRWQNLWIEIFERGDNNESREVMDRLFEAAEKLEKVLGIKKEQ
jgi:hypothetical protein